MEVKLLHITPLDILVKAIRKCYDSGDNSDSCYEANPMIKFVLGSKDKALIERIIESRHHSVLEHISITFEIGGYSRSLLQQKSRHRIGVSVSEQSTRYCLKKMFSDIPINKDNVEEFSQLTDIPEIDNLIIETLEKLRVIVKNNPSIKNDDAKLALPEALFSTSIMTFNIRSFREWLDQRTDKHAHWEIQKLAHMMYIVLPQEYKFLVKDCVHEEEVKC